MNEQPEAIRDLLAQAARQTDYPAEALEFVFAGHLAAQQRLSSVPFDVAPAIVPPEIVCCWVCRMAWEKFGENAQRTLASWQLQGPVDVGRIVLHLHARQLLERPADECLKDYRCVSSFAEVLDVLAHAEPSDSRLGPYQFGLSTLLLLTTVLAVAFAGFGRLRFQGVVIAMFIFWLACIAAVCFWTAIRYRGQGRAAGLLVGLLMALAAALGFMHLFVYSQDLSP